MNKVYKLSMAAIAASLVLVNCSSIEDLVGGDDDNDAPTINVTTPSGQTVDAGPVTEKTDIWIVKNVNQAEVDRLTALAPRLDPGAITLVADMSCTELRSSYSLISGLETLSSGYEALTYYFQNDGYSDNNFYCKEYSLPSNAANYGNLTIAIGSWNDDIDQSDHHGYISSDTSSSNTSSSNEDILIMTKQSNTAFTIEWNKNYIIMSDGDSSFGRSSIGYVEYNKDPDSMEQYTQVIAQHLLISEHQITCSKWMDEDIDGKVVFRCDDIMTYDDGVPHESTSYIRIKPDLTYYFGRRYSTENPLELDEWQGSDYEVSYTSDGTLTIE